MKKLLISKNISVIVILIGLVIVTIISIVISATNAPNYEGTLSKSWNYYKEKYIQSDGRVIDYTTPNLETTSEGMTYAMLESVTENDPTEFKKLTLWLYANMGVRNDGLFAWQWGKKSDGTYGVLTDLNGQNSASDADIQAAEALLLASQKWNNTDYHIKAISLMQSIYEYDTTTRGTAIYIVGGNWANDTNIISQNTIYSDPSYLQIASFRDFAKADTKDNWNAVISSSYSVLNLCTFTNSNQLQISPNWCLIDKDTNTIITTNTSFPEEYGYDAFRTMYNIALDYKRYHDSKDVTYLNNTAKTYYNLYKKDPRSIGNTYNLTTSQATETQSLAIMTGEIANFYVTHPSEAVSELNANILSKYNTSTGKIGDNYYDSNWAWFITYLFSDLSNTSSS